jgi:hypothetical protein
MCRLQRIYGAVHCHAISTRQDNHDLQNAFGILKQ